MWSANLRMQGVFVISTLWMWFMISMNQIVKNINAPLEFVNAHEIAEFHVSDFGGRQTRLFVGSHIWRVQLLPRGGRIIHSFTLRFVLTNGNLHRRQKSFNHANLFIITHFIHLNCAPRFRTNRIIWCSFFIGHIFFRLDPFNVFSHLSCSWASFTPRNEKSYSRILAHL